MTYELDLKDKKILAYLDFNGRATYSEIGKSVRLSKQVVEYRVNKLVRDNVIIGFVPMINAQQLGYLYSRLWLTLQNCTAQQKHEIIEYLKADNNVFWMFEMQGNFDIFLGRWHKTLEEFRVFTEMLMDKYGHFIRQRLENFATNLHGLPSRYLLPAHDAPSIVMKAKPMQVKIDNTDKEILEQICTNARKSLVEIGKTVGEHPRVISYRLKKMEQQNIILGYRAVVNHSLLGYTYYKVLINLNKYAAADVAAVKEFIKTHPAAVYLVEGVGLSADIDCEVVVKDNEQLFDFINKLRDRFPSVIGNYTTVAFVKEHKTQFLPLEITQ